MPDCLFLSRIDFLRGGSRSSSRRQRLQLRRLRALRRNSRLVLWRSGLRRRLRERRTGNEQYCAYKCESVFHEFSLGWWHQVRASILAKSSVPRHGSISRLAHRGRLGSTALPLVIISKETIAFAIEIHSRQAVRSGRCLKGALLR